MKRVQTREKLGAFCACWRALPPAPAGSLVLSGRCGPAPAGSVSVLHRVPSCLCLSPCCQRAFCWGQSRLRFHCPLVLLPEIHPDVFVAFLMSVWVACSVWLLEAVLSWETPGAPVIKTPHCRCRRPGLHPWPGG